MNFNIDLLNLDFLVFSSHKTATQSLVNTLNQNNLRTKHCHVLDNIGMETGAFLPYLRTYVQQNQRKLNVITIFREPVARHISSFFQWYGSKPLFRKEVDSEFETIIYRNSIEDLQQQLINEINEKSLIGIEESIDQICDELQIDISDLNYDEEKKFGLYEHDYCKIYLLRFDEVTRNFTDLVSQITGKKITEHQYANQSADKWYNSIYAEFKKSLRIPPETINDIYNSRIALFNLFYPGKFAPLLNLALEKYAPNKKGCKKNQCQNGLRQ